MSVSFQDEDEPMENDRCELHDEVRPCMHCFDDYADWTYMDKLEGRA